MINTDQESGHYKQITKFDDSQAGVKGLVDSGITSIPQIFIHPPDTLSDTEHVNNSLASDINIPTIDLSDVDSNGKRSVIVDQVSRAAREVGFFQIVNHGVPLEVMEKAIGGVKAFHEMPTEVKRRWYGRDPANGANYYSNLDLFRSKAASWRDTLLLRLSPNQVATDEIPEICRKELIEWIQQAVPVAELLSELLCEGLGLKSTTLKEMSCLEDKTMVGQYYPYCAQPHLTVGAKSHTDPVILTVLIQDSIGGLQVDCGGQWVDVKPIPGAMVINIGDTLQIMSNDAYKSVHHRVRANTCDQPRISIAMFFNARKDREYGPFPDLISAEKPAIYKQFVLADCLQKFFTKELDVNTLPKFLKLHH